MDDTAAFQLPVFTVLAWVFPTVDISAATSPAWVVSRGEDIVSDTTALNLLVAQSSSSLPNDGVSVLYETSGDTDIVSFSKQIPVDKQEAFLIGLGFEKEPAHRTSKSLLHSVLFLIMLVSVVGSVALALIFHRIIYLSGIIGGLITCHMIYDIYKEEEA